MIDSYLKYINSIRRYSGRTCEIYREALERFADWTGKGNRDISPEFLTSTIIRSYEVHLMDECKMNPRSVNLHLSILSGLCRYLMKQGLISSNPIRSVKRPKEEKRIPQFYREEALRKYFADTDYLISDEQLAIFKSSPASKLGKDLFERRLRRLIISILANTGIRRSELISLNRSSIDFGRSKLTVLGKGDKMREIPLIPSLCEEISMYLEAVGALQGGIPSREEPLLTGYSGKRLYSVAVDRAVKEELGSVEGITGRKSPHVLRHTLATELLSDKTDLNSIKELLGHSSLAATQVYTHNSIERLKSVYNEAHPRAKKG